MYLRLEVVLGSNQTHLNEDIQSGSGEVGMQLQVPNTCKKIVM